LCDNSNLQEIILPDWKSNFNVTKLLNLIPQFLNKIDYEFTQNLLSPLGKYSINFNVYNVNDFLLKQENSLFKIEIVSHTKNGMNFEEKYLILTDINLILLNPISDRNKTKAHVVFVCEIRFIEKMVRLNIEDKNFNDKPCIKIHWSAFSPLYFENLITCETYNVNKIIDEINLRKSKIISKFQYFFKDENNSVEDIERIIHIKMKVLEMKKDEKVFNEIIECYQKIIEIFTINNDDGYQIYTNKLHELISNYVGK
jgi:hypothetical protein